MHPHMIVDIDEAVELTRLERKLTVIMPVSNGPIECMLWSVFSLLLRARVKDLIEHFIIVFNGPDHRTGDEAPCDKKQQFLEELRGMKWWRPEFPKHKRDMPLTVIRVWSRIGHPEAVEMAVPWVHTDAYLIVHDDIIITKNEWLRDVEKNFFDKPDVVIAYGTPNLMCCQQDSAIHQGKNLLRFPHLLCAFLVCRKKMLSKLGSSWCGYSINTPPFMLSERVGNVEEFLKYYDDMNLNHNPPQTQEPYEFVSMEMGAWHFYNAIQAGYKFENLIDDGVPILEHLGAMSWEIDTGKKVRISRLREHVACLEQEIFKHPEYAQLYLKYLPDEYKSNIQQGKNS